MEGHHHRPDARHVLPGGAKRENDGVPEHPNMSDLLKRYLRSIIALRSAHRTLREDLGVQQKLIGKIIEELGLKNSEQAVCPLWEARNTATELWCGVSTLTGWDWAKWLVDAAVQHRS